MLDIESVFISGCSGNAQTQHSQIVLSITLLLFVFHFLFLLTCETEVCWIGAIKLLSRLFQLINDQIIANDMVVMWASAVLSHLQRWFNYTLKIVLGLLKVFRFEIFKSCLSLCRLLIVDAIEWKDNLFKHSEMLTTIFTSLVLNVRVSIMIHKGPPLFELIDHHATPHSSITFILASVKKSMLEYLSIIVLLRLIGWILCL